MSGSGRQATGLSGLRVNGATLADLEVMTGFSVAMAGQSENRQVDVRQVRAGMRRLLEDPSLGRTFIARDGDAPVGMIVAGGREWSEWRNGMYVWITGLYVMPEYRRRGVRSLLYRHLRAWCREQPGVIGVRAYVAGSNRLNLKFHGWTDYRITEELF